MKKKKTIIWFIIVIAILAVASLAYNRLSSVYAKGNLEKESIEESSVDTTIQNRADDFTVYDENEKQVKLSDYMGKPLIVNFWASWCPPCNREMPAFQKAMDMYGEEATFLMINEADGERETMDTAQAFLEDNGYEMNVLYDLDQDAGNTYNTLYLPRTLFIDENGNIVEDHVGELSEKELTDAIEKLVYQSNGQSSDALNEYKDVSITYAFGDMTEVIDNAKIMSWLEVSSSKVIVDEGKVQEYVAELASKYDTVNKKREFQTHDRETIQLDTNEYGYQIDKEKEVQQILADIQGKAAVQREPVYSVEGNGRNGMDDLQGNYIEVSLEKQHLWLYKNGNLITDTDIVSGLPTEDRATYTGAWSIAYKASPYTLSSEVYGYSTEVKYWMPFVCGQGLHDADWQTEFGGDVYKTKGSHGCINLPPNQAEIIYNTIEKGYPVICY